MYVRCTFTFLRGGVYFCCYFYVIKQAKFHVENKAQSNKFSLGRLKEAALENNTVVLEYNTNFSLIEKKIKISILNLISSSPFSLKPILIYLLTG